MIELILALGIVGFLVAYLFFQNKEDNHVALRILMLGVLFGIFILLGKAGIDSTTECEPVLNQTVVNNLTTTYSYDTFCYQKTKSNTASILYKVTLWLVRLLGLYLLVYFIWEFFKWFSQIISGKYGRTKD